MRISTTTIEAFRLMLTTDWKPEAEVIASIKGDFRPTWHMEAGTAWGEIIEGKHQSDEHGHYHFGDCKYRFEDVLEAGRTFKRGGCHECKAVVDVDGIQVVAKVDHIWGTEITEFKARFGTLDYQQYEQGLQWRFYLWAFGASSVTYQLFRFAEPDNEGLVILKEIGSVRFWAYRGLADECRYWVGEFARWAESKGLAGFLERKAA